jgi:hypothetical protein
MKQKCSKLGGAGATIGWLVVIEADLWKGYVSR